ncbi:DUF5606 domain-containing protein [Aureibaculum sp. 2210JD6-5]|uniref:DUF5606 family protein n=1 Tax=Aureibaculum sp. 2210JD6-5 TaxID=3103957 RepID=UPI002AACC829|nr:DUF5606 domain-containing protein [Aureibaculum sp. 2210JD6-5]MDY7393699.1 DUF5606 domain-containing protein [Aureibaculum sp. 2210JD6-5]
MTLEKIVAITGKPGLYEIVSQTKGGLLVQSLIDKKRMPVNAMQNVSVLNDIAIYTYEDEMPLRNILKNMAEKLNNKEALSHKESNDKLKSFFSEVLPNYDEERVYASNIKKVVQWYNVLAATNFDFSSIKEESDEEE